MVSRDRAGVKQAVFLWQKHRFCFDAEAVFDLGFSGNLRENIAANTRITTAATASATGAVYEMP